MTPKADRLKPVMRKPHTKLQERLGIAIGDRSIQSVADDWDVPYWVIRDTLKGSTDCPRGLYIPAMARGLGVTTDQVIEDAYTPVEAVPA